MSDIFDEEIEEIQAQPEVATQPEAVQETEVPKEKKKYRPGVGVDVGTSNIVVARQTEDGTFVNRFHRDMLYPLDVSEEAIDLLDRSDYLYVKVGKKYYIVGEDALRLVNAIGRGEIVRPMKDGILNPNLKESSELLFYIIKAVVGDPIVPNEPLRFSVPANPVDRDLDNKFHEMVLKNFFSQMGYDAKPVNEAMSVAYDCAPVTKTDEGEMPLTGIAISCLTPDMPIITNRGIVPIKKVHIGDRVLTKGGTYERVFNVVPTQKNNEEIQVIDFYSSSIPLKLTGDHQIFIKDKNGSERWKESKFVEKGDMVMMPSVKYKNKKQYIRFQKNITSSKKKNVKQYEVSEKVAKFIGLFLGDGHVWESNGGVFFDFGIHEEYLCDLVEDVANNIFKNSMSFIRKGDNCIRCQMNNKGLSKWLKERCYDSEGNKTLPWEIDEMNRPCRIGLLSGLLESDGCINEESISFESTSNMLTMLVMQLCNSEGITGSYNERVRENAHLKGCPISYVSNFVVNKKFVPMLNLLLKNKRHSTRNDLDIVQWNVVKSNNVTTYDGIVYDLKVENDHSFCLPNCCVHNCGGGMTNVALCLKGLSLNEFSITKSGDYIDSQAAKVTGMASSKVIKLKEKKLDLGSFDMSERVLAALRIYYQETISRIIHHMSEEFKSTDAEVDGELEVVIAGGTSMPKGYCKMFKDSLDDSEFPFEVWNVRHSDSPFYSVSQGSCIRAQADFRKKNK